LPVARGLKPEPLASALVTAVAERRGRETAQARCTRKTRGHLRGSGGIAPRPR
jgi:hypothetical protein